MWREINSAEPMTVSSVVLFGTMDGYVLTEDIVITDAQSGGLVFVF